MSILNLWGRDPEKVLRPFRETPGAILLDVRTEEEFECGSLPESQNLPVQRIEEIQALIPNRDTPIFLCCQSGARSCYAAQLLWKMGYTHVTDLGGIAEC